jgi:hypothetical protein
MRLVAYMLVLAFSLAEGVAMIPGPCCLSALFGPEAGANAECPHCSTKAPEEGCCQRDGSETRSCCSEERGGSTREIEGTPSSCGCKYQNAGHNDKTLDSGWDETSIQLLQTVSLQPEKFPANVSPQRYEIHGSAETPPIPIPIILGSLLL